MEGAGLDQPEVGDERAVRRDVLDAADQVAERRVELLDDRRARPSLVLRDEDVDFVAVEADRPAPDPPPRLRPPRFLATNSGDIFDQVGAHRLQMLGDARQSANSALTSSIR